MKKALVLLLILTTISVKAASIKPEASPEPNWTKVKNVEPFDTLQLCETAKKELDRDKMKSLSGLLLNYRCFPLEVEGGKAGLSYELQEARISPFIIPESKPIITPPSISNLNKPIQPEKWIRKMTSITIGIQGIHGYQTSILTIPSFPDNGKCKSFIKENLARSSSYDCRRNPEGKWELWQVNVNTRMNIGRRGGIRS